MLDENEILNYTLHSDKIYDELIQNAKNDKTNELYDTYLDICSTLSSGECLDFISKMNNASQFQKSKTKPLIYAMLLHTTMFHPDTIPQVIGFIAQKSKPEDLNNQTQLAKQTTENYIFSILNRVSLQDKPTWATALKISEKLPCRNINENTTKFYSKALTNEPAFTL